MRAIFKLLLVVVLAIMLRPQLIQLQDVALVLLKQSHLVLLAMLRKTLPQAFSMNETQANASTLRARGLIAKSGLELLTFDTPNGHKATILLEELKAAYGREYIYQSIYITQNVQKEPWFTKLSPNGKIPVLVDHDYKHLSIMEGSAILSYLCRHYDPKYKFTFKKDPELSKVEQWVAWQTGGIGPMQGQLNHFYRLAKERIPYPTQRYLGEVERLYGVLNTALEETDYLVGNKYTIADIANFSWVNAAIFAGIDLAQFPNVQKWWERINARSAVQKGTSVPSPPSMFNEMVQRRLDGDHEFRTQEERLLDLARKAKEQYGYKYSSP